MRCRVEKNKITVTVTRKNRKTPWVAHIYPIKRFGEVHVEFTEDEYDNMRTAIGDLDYLIKRVKKEIIDGLND